MLVVYKYKSKRTKEIEWRRGIILGKIANTSWKNAHYSVESIDFGTVVDVYFKDLKKMFKPFGQMPKQAVEAKLAGISPFLYNKIAPVFTIYRIVKGSGEVENLQFCISQKYVKMCGLHAMRGFASNVLRQICSFTLKFLSVSRPRMTLNVRFYNTLFIFAICVIFRFF